MLSLGLQAGEQLICPEVEKGRSYGFFLLCFLEKFLSRTNCVYGTGYTNSQIKETELIEWMTLRKSCLR